MGSISYAVTVNNNHHAGLTLAQRVALSVHLLLGANPIVEAWNAASDPVRDEAVSTIGIESLWGTLCRVL
jgi:hypothetical protein